MKKLLLTLYIALSSIMGIAQDIGGDHYVAHPDSTYSGMNPASDLNDGSYLNPWASLQHALENTQAGETTYFRDGVWEITTTEFQSNIFLLDPYGRQQSGTTRGYVGTQENPIQYLNYPGERATFDCRQVPNFGNFLGGLSMLNAHYTYFRGIEIKNIYQGAFGVSVNGMSTDFCSNLTFENVNVHDIGGRGAWITSVIGVFGRMQDSIASNLYDCDLNPCIDTLHNVLADTTRIINSDFYNCADTLRTTPFNMGDGIKGDLEAGGVFIVEGSRFWNNSDDGIDLSGAGQKILTNTWTWDQGVNYIGIDDVDDGNGFKLGGVRDSIDIPNWIMTRCISANNYRFAIHSLDYHPYYRNNARVYNSIFWGNNTGQSAGPWSFDNVNKPWEDSEFYNCVTQNHAGLQIRYPREHPVVTSNWDWADGSNPYVIPNSVCTVDASDFVSIDTDLLAAPRKADNSLPDVSTFKLVASSDMIDVGTNVGLPYSGSAPDVGVFEFEGVITADHTVVDLYNQIPQQWIDSVKTMRMAIAGASHGSNYVYGCRDLELLDPKFAHDFQTYGTPRTNDGTQLLLNEGMWGDFENTTGWVWQSRAEDFWTNTTANTRVKAGLDYYNTTGPKTDALMYGWSYETTQFPPSGSYDPIYHTRWGGKTDQGPQGSIAWGLDDGDTALTGNTVNMDTYITQMEDYISYCETNNLPTQMIWSTGPVDEDVPGLSTGESGYQQYLKYEHIRQYVNSLNEGYFIDYADILSYNDAGVQTTTTWTDSNSTLQTYPLISPENYQAPITGHVGPAGHLKLAKATWWLLARMAGWDGVTTAGDPVASFTAIPNPAEENQTITFDGSSSTDGGTITNYAWEFGDGNVDNGAIVTHSYATANNYTARLTVTDDEANTGTTTRTVTVNATPIGGITTIAELDAAQATAVGGDTLKLESNSFVGDITIYADGDNGNPLVIIAEDGYVPVFSDNVTLTGDYVKFESVSFSGNLSLSSPTSPSIVYCSFIGTGEKMTITFPFNDWEGNLWTIDYNDYTNMSSGGTIDGYRKSIWRALYKGKFDNNSLF